jgi:hypothetical protein
VSNSGKREIQPLPGYQRSWQNFEKVIKKAMVSCEAPGNLVDDQFNDAIKVIVGGKGAVQQVRDYYLSRLACYLIASAPVKGIHLSKVTDLAPCGNGDCSVPSFRAKR